MVQSALDVCNLAIARIGGETIDALDEETPLGAYCLTTYPQKKAWLLSKHRWGFATGRAPLARLLETPADCSLSYAFTRPADLVGAVWSWKGGGGRDAESVYVLPQEKCVASESPTLFAEYTRAVPEAEWPPWFVELVRIAFASDLAAQIQNRSLSADLFAIAFGTPSDNGEGGLLAAARIEDGRDAPQRNLGGWDDGALVMARMGGGWPGCGYRLPGSGALTFIDPE